MLPETKTRWGPARAASASDLTESSCCAYVRRLLSMRCGRPAVPRGPVSSLGAGVGFSAGKG